MTPDFLRATEGGVSISIKLQPRASREQILGVQNGELKICVTAPPVDSAANRALTEFMAEILDVPRSAVALTRGQTSRHKVIFVSGISIEEATAKFEAHLR